MRVSETIVLELKDGRATISIAELTRIVEMPSNRVLGELCTTEETCLEGTSDGDRRSSR